jgi:hypothetical protein
MIPTAIMKMSFDFAYLNSAKKPIFSFGAANCLSMIIRSSSLKSSDVDDGAIPSDPARRFSPASDIETWYSFVGCAAMWCGKVDLRWGNVKQCSMIRLVELRR